MTPPYILGGILTHKTEPAIFTLMVYDPRNAQNRRFWNIPSRMASPPASRSRFPSPSAASPAYQGVRGVYSTLNGTDFRDIPDLILPGGTQNLGTIDGYWFASYSFQQYLVEDDQDPQRGWGLFGQIAVSDGNPNPFGWSGFIGIGGSSLFAIARTTASALPISTTGFPTT